mmetsp:Transcript_46920/g.80798  ORF Transcript_46920/g.80798 Transcript_46920/m.80798 type:complete len:226 (+) Transcript_46920:878-1555(+)
MWLAAATVGAGGRPRPPSRTRTRAWRRGGRARCGGCGARWTFSRGRTTRRCSRTPRCSWGRAGSCWTTARRCSGTTRGSWARSAAACTRWTRPVASAPGRAPPWRPPPALTRAGRRRRGRRPPPSCSSAASSGPATPVWPPACRRYRRWCWRGAQRWERGQIGSSAGWLETTETIQWMTPSLVRPTRTARAAAPRSWARAPTPWWRSTPAHCSSAAPAPPSTTQT